ncbi:MAG: hypothetical protein K0S65_5225 [Labilithrix sp.]|nr:hypothetical protein [Labilithrix sp.]
MPGARGLRPARDALGALLAIDDLLEAGHTAADEFADLVQIMCDVLPFTAVAVDSLPHQTSLVWCASDDPAENTRIDSILDAVITYFSTPASLDDFNALTHSSNERWICLPLAAGDGSTIGLFAAAVAAEVDETTVAFISCITRHLSRALTRAASLERVFARLNDQTAAPRADVLRPHGDDVRAGWPARAVRVASELTVLLLSNFEYMVSLHHVARVVSTRLAGGCIIDIEENGALSRIACASSHAFPESSDAIEQVVGRVMRRGASVAVYEEDRDKEYDDDDELRDHAQRAKAALGVEWLTCVPIRSRGRTVGAITVLGSSERPPLPRELIEELGRHAGTAVGNSRRYQDALTATRARDELISMASHDLKSPLGIILMSAAELLAGAPEIERGSVDEHVRAIQRSATRMKKLIGDLLDVEHGAVSLHPSGRDPRELVGETLEDLFPSATVAGVWLANVVPSGLPLLWVDSDRVVQVLTNIVGNAIKFTSRGGFVRVRAELSARQLVLSISDSGIGISAEDLPHIFDRFWQGRHTVKEGSGLGLAISKSLVELLGGEIWAESRPGIGTTVSFSLPLAVAAP